MSQQRINQPLKLLLLGFALSIGTGCEIDLSDFLDNGDAVPDAATSTAVESEFDETAGADAEPTDTGIIDPTNVEGTEQDLGKVVVIGWDYLNKVTNPDLLLNFNVEFETLPNGDNATNPDPHCQVDILGTYEAAAGETIDIEWDMTGDVSTEVYISVHSGWGSEYYLHTVVLNTGNLQWELPEDLDPTLDYNIYVESADDGERTTICWRYADLVVLEPEPEQCNIDILGSYEAAPGETIDIEWDMTGDVSSEVYIAVFSGWGTQYYLTTVVQNTGSFEWKLPEDLDPEFDYDIYVESADDSHRTTICWRYAALEVIDL
jgi:hypothetical protein